MSMKRNTLNAIEQNSVTDVWKREYNETSERIEAGYANEDAYRPLKQKINEFLDQKFRKRAFWRNVIRKLTIGMLVLWIIVIIVGQLYANYGAKWYEFNGFLRKAIRIDTHDFKGILEMLSVMLPVVYVVLLLIFRSFRKKSEKSIAEAVAFDERYFAGEICRLRNAE